MSGLIWQTHLDSLLKEHSWIPVPAFPSCYIKDRGGKDGVLFLVIYVDDFVMSGKDLKPEWDLLSKVVKFGTPPAPLTRFLGVNHNIT